MRPTSGSSLADPGGKHSRRGPRSTRQIRVAVGAARASGRARRLEVRRYQLVRSLDGWGCGASSLAYIWMRSFRGSYIGRRDTVAG